jgi:glycosyl transferase family 25
MKCLVINLDRSAGRLAQVTRQFARIGVPFQRVAGVDAAGGSVTAAPPLTAPEAACFLSHRQCWQIIADGGDHHGAIFEDDVIFADNGGALLADDGWIPRDADVVKLETFFVPVRLRRRRVAVGDGYSLVRLVGRHVGAAGYILSRDAARKLLARTRRFKAAVDNVLFCPTMTTCSRNTIYQLMPALCAQAHLLPGDEIPVSLMQADHNVRKSLTDRIGAEASRAFAHLRNGTLLGTDKVDAVPFRDSAMRLPRSAGAR